MAIITEQNCPTLRYLKWNLSLLKHPEFQKFMRKNNQKGYQSLPLNLPFLDMNYYNQDVWAAHDRVINSWEKLSPLFREDIWTASLAYGKAFENATDTICKHRLELYQQMTGKVYNGTYVQTTKDSPLCLLYSIDLRDVRWELRDDGQEGIHILWDGFILMVSGRNLAAIAYSKLDDGIVETGAHPHLSNVFVKANGGVDAALVFEALDNLVFRRFADVTVREVTSRSPSLKEAADGDADENTVIIKSTLRSDIDRYDINWYTESVRTAGFARKGYIGLRWKGTRGNQHPEFVPVKGTWVKGYTRRARKPASEMTLKDFETARQ